MSSVNSHTGHSERPERSRNAKAQARHRAKRKAYIEQLESTVTKLQTVLGFSPEQVAALPPPLVKIRELEQDVARLQKENDDLRRVISDRGLQADLPRRNSFATYTDSRNCDRGDYNHKRRRMSGHLDGVYMSPNDTPPHTHDHLRPPPLTIPQPLSHYSTMGSNSSSQHSGSSMFSLHAPAFQMPNTPSGSSATSSPEFSHTQIPIHPQSPVNQRPPLSNHHALSGYQQHHSAQYEPVKVEDENYLPVNHAPQNHYPLPSYPSAHPQDNNMDSSWHAYSSERAHPLHR